MMKDELKFYSRNRSRLNKTYCNEYVLIHGCRVVGHFNSPKEAYKAACKNFPNEEWLCFEAHPFGASLRLLNKYSRQMVKNSNMGFFNGSAQNFLTMP